LQNHDSLAVILFFFINLQPSKHIKINKPDAYAVTSSAPKGVIFFQNLLNLTGLPTSRIFIFGAQKSDT